MYVYCDVARSLLRTRQGRRHPFALRESPMHHRLLLLPLATLTFVTSGAAQLMSNPAQWYVNNSIYSSRVFNSTVGTSTASRTAGVR